VLYNMSVAGVRVVEFGTYGSCVRAPSVPAPGQFSILLDDLQLLEYLRMDLTRSAVQRFVRTSTVTIRKRQI